MFGNCSFDDAFVALVHLVGKHPTFSILSSRFSPHHELQACSLLGHYILGNSNKFITRFYFCFSCFLSCLFLISSCEFCYCEHFQTCSFVLLTSAHFARILCEEMQCSNDKCFRCKGTHTSWYIV